MNKTFLFFIACLCLFSGKLFASNTTTNLKQKSQQLNTVKTQINQLKKNLSVNQDKRQELMQKLKKTDVEIGNVANELSSIEEKLKHQNVSLEQVSISQNNLQKQLDEQRTLLAQQIRAHYTLGHQEPIKILLNPQSLNQLNRITTYYQYIYDARKKLLLSIQATLDQITATRQRMASIKQAMELLKQQKESKHNNILEQQTQQKNLIVTLNQKITTSGTQLKELEKNKKSLEELITHIRSLSVSHYKPGIPLSKLHGKLIWPTKGLVISRYGDRLSHTLIKSNGIKIKASEGREVQAVYSGKVLFSDWLKGFGLLLIVEHGEGYMTLYANNKSLYKKPGEIVQAGESIATVGHSGGNTENGLYFEIRKNGKPENPKYWLKPA